jgi:transcriptional regulator with XRE-family HTH domain
LSVLFSFDAEDVSLSLPKHWPIPVPVQLDLFEEEAPTNIYVGYVPTENDPLNPPIYLVCNDDTGDIAWSIHLNGSAPPPSATLEPTTPTAPAPDSEPRRVRVKERLHGTLSQAQLSKIEHGRIQPDEETVSKIAQALKYRPSFFYDSVYQRMPPVSFHRARQKLGAKDREAIHGQAEVYRINLKKLLASVELEIRLPSVPAIDPDQYSKDISKIAQTVRQRWGTPRGPIRDLTKIVEDAGVIIVAFDFGTPLIDGFSQQAGDGLPSIIFINSRQPKDRYRFSLAHELGHLVMHQTPNPEQEVQANLFASEFLMPELRRRPRGLGRFRS